MIEQDIIEYLKTKGCQFKQQGGEYLTDCPFCGKPQKLSVNPEKGVWRCWVCNEVGNIWKLKKFYGDINIREFIPKKIKYKHPAKTTDQKYHKALLENKKALDYLMNERGFTIETIKKFKLGRDNQNIAIPYYQKGILVNFKFRGIDKKGYYREEGCQSTLYNIDNLDVSKPVILTEGEFDCISAVQLGFENVLSVPTGAGAFDNKWIDVFENVGEISIVYDNDEAGENGAKKIAEKLGIARCKRVKLPFEDFNDCLMAGQKKEDLDKFFEQAEEYKLAGIIHVSEVLDEIENLWEKGETLKGEPLTDWKNFTFALGGMREGEITTLSGETASGKSTFAMNLIYQLLEQKQSCIIFSNEMSNRALLSKLFAMHQKKAFHNLNKKEILESMQFFGEKSLFFAEATKDLHIEKISEYLIYASNRFDVRFVLLDHLHFFLPDGIDRRVYEVEQFMRGIVDVAKKTKVNVLLVAHPHKLKNEAGYVQMNDLKGSSAIKQDSDNIIMLWRNRKKEEDKQVYEVFADIQKVRDDSAIGGKIRFLFNPTSQKYTEAKDDKRFEGNAL